MIEAGKAYVTTNRLFVSGVRDLSQQCQGDTVISVRAPDLWLTSGLLHPGRHGHGQAAPAGAQALGASGHLCGWQEWLCGPVAGETLALGGPGCLPSASI